VASIKQQRVGAKVLAGNSDDENSYHLYLKWSLNSPYKSTGAAFHSRSVITVLNNNIIKILRARNHKAILSLISLIKLFSQPSFSSGLGKAVRLSLSSSPSHK
jgi:hypothetical protein